MTKLMPDPYGVLEIPREADEQEVRDAYRRMARRYHPDLHPDLQTSERIRRVNEAWHVLSDPARRARYNADHPRVGSPTASYQSGSPHRPGAAPGAAPTWQRAWTTAAPPTGPDSAPAGWGSTSWRSRPRREPRPSAEASSAGGPPWLAVLAILAVGWIVAGGILGGLLLPPGLGVVALLAGAWILSRAD